MGNLRQNRRRLEAGWERVPGRGARRINKDNEIMTCYHCCCSVAILYPYFFVVCASYLPSVWLTTRVFITFQFSPVRSRKKTATIVCHLVRYCSRPLRLCVIFILRKLNLLRIEQLAGLYERFLCDFRLRFNFYFRSMLSGPFHCFVVRGIDCCFAFILTEKLLLLFSTFLLRMMMMMMMLSGTSAKRDQKRQYWLPRSDKNNILFSGRWLNPFNFFPLFCVRPHARRMMMMSIVAREIWNIVSIRSLSERAANWHDWQRVECLNWPSDHSKWVNRYER